VVYLPPDLGTLPFTQDGRIVSLAGFRERMDEAEKTAPALQVRWVERRGEWTGTLTACGSTLSCSVTSGR
jgi:hypothetical protein